MRKTLLALACAAAIGGTATAAMADVGVDEDECGTVVSAAPGEGAPGFFLSVQTDDPNVWVYSDNGDGELDRRDGSGEFDEVTMTENENCRGSGSDEQVY